MSGYWEIPNDYQSDNGTFNGSAHSVSSIPLEIDRAAEVRKIAEEVSGKIFPIPESRRIGFLP